MAETKYHNQSWTLHLPLMFFDSSFNINYKFKIEDQSNNEKTTNHLISICLQKVLPLFDELNDNYKFYSLIWQLIEQKFPFGNTESNYSSGLITAYLFNKNSLSAHIDFIEQKIQMMNPLSNSRLTNLISYLKLNS